MDEPASARLRLVHGWCEHITPGYERGMVYGHAWVLLPGGRVYDAVKDKNFSAHDYAVQHHAIVGRVFTPKQAAKAFQQHKHLGPWWSDDEMRMHVSNNLPTGWIMSGKRRSR